MWLAGDLAGAFTSLHGVECVETAHGDHMKHEHDQKGVRELHVWLGTVVVVFLGGLHGCRACAQPSGAFRSHRVYRVLGYGYLIMLVADFREVIERGF